MLDLLVNTWQITLGAFYYSASCICLYNDPPETVS